MLPEIRSSSTTFSMILDDPSSTPGSIEDIADTPGKSFILRRARSNPFLVTPVLSAFSKYSVKISLYNLRFSAFITYGSFLSKRPSLIFINIIPSTTSCSGRVTFARKKSLTR